MTEPFVVDGITYDPFAQFTIYARRMFELIDDLDCEKSERDHDTCGAPRWMSQEVDEEIWLRHGELVYTGNKEAVAYWQAMALIDEDLSRKLMDIWTSPHRIRDYRDGDFRSYNVWFVDQVQEIHPERWVDIYGGAYQVSNQGRVRCTDLPDRPHVRPWRDHDGYNRVTVVFRGRSRSVRVHNLVARVFVPGYARGWHVEHLDTFKSNDLSINLVWVRSGQNLAR